MKKSTITTKLKRLRSYQLFVYIIDLNEESFVVDTDNSRQA